MITFDYKNYDISKNYCIEASAGTGKTFNIIEIVRKLLSCGVPINKILIVTYTDKACGELRNRIRKITTDHAEIYTIHSFCEAMTKEFGISGNLPLDMSFAKDTELEKFCDAYFRDEEIYQDIVIAMSLDIEFKIDTLKEYFIGLVNKYYLTKDNEEDPSIITLDNMSGYLDLYDYVFKGSGKLYDQAFEYINQLKSSNDLIFKTKPNSFASNYGLQLEKSFPNFNLDGLNNLKSYSPFYETYKFFKSLNDARSAALLQEILAAKYLRDFYIKWNKEKKSRKLQSFSDMIRNVREEVHTNNDFKEKIKTKYQYAIIDEFQDTNKLQWDIFNKLFLTDQEHHLVVVGDPKQSIYSFQGADLFVYEEAKKKIVENGGLLCSLDKNYRSSKGIVEACNNFFSLDYFKDDDLVKIDFVPSKYKDASDVEEKAKYEGQDIKSFLICGSASSPVKDFEYAKTIADKIIDFCTKIGGKTKLQISTPSGYRDVTFKDFAILCRTSTEMEPIEKALKNIGIPYIRYKDQKLFKGLECANWIALLDCLACQDLTGINRNKFRKTLFTKFFNVSLKDINNPYYDLDDIPEMHLLNKWQQDFKNANYENLVDSIMVESGLFDRLNESSSIQSLNIFKQLGDYVVEYLSQNHDLNELVRHLQNLLDDEEDTKSSDDNAEIIGIGTNFDCVQIMTIHASKGLEFPVVFFASSSIKKYAQAKLCTYHDKLEQKIAFGSSKDTREWNEEVKRLYYVAFTRPKHLLIIPRYNDIKIPFFGEAIDNFIENKKDYYAPLPISYTKTKTLKENLQNILNEHKCPYEQDKKLAQDKLLLDLIEKVKTLSCYKHSYSSLSHGNSTNLVIEEDENKEGVYTSGLAKYDLDGIVIDGIYNKEEKDLEFPHDYPKGATLGTALHEVFEKLSFTNYKDNLDNLIMDCFKKQGYSLNPEWISVTKELVERVLNAKLPCVKGSKKVNEFFMLKEIKDLDKLSEVEFNFNVLGERLKNYLNGFIDLLFRRDEVYSLLDWKSDTLNDEEFTSFSNIDDLCNHTSNRYAIQRVLYSYCLIKWLKNFYQETEEEIFNNHFGGIYYVYLRGCTKESTNGVFVKTWHSFAELEKAFKQIESLMGGVNND